MSETVDATIPAAERIFEPFIGSWDPVVRLFTARRIGARVVPDTRPRMRWTLSDVSESAFASTDEVDEDGVWRAQQTFAARRRERDGPCPPP